MQIGFLWGFCTGAQGAYTPKTPVSGPGRELANYLGNMTARRAGDDAGGAAAHPLIVGPAPSGAAVIAVGPGAAIALGLAAGAFVFRAVQAGAYHCSEPL
jgi:hypothetical protein